MNNKYNLSKDFLFKEYIINKKSTTEIANIIGCYYGTIIHSLIKFNIKVRTKKEGLKFSKNLGRKRKYLNILTEKFLKENYINKKYSSFDIGKQLNIDASLIRKYLIFYNIPIRIKHDIDKMQTGCLSPMWKGGYRKDDYPFEFNKKLKLDNEIISLVKIAD